VAGGTDDRSSCSYVSAQGGKPGERLLSRWLVPLGNRGQSLRDDLGVDELGVEQGCHEVLVLLAEGAELGGTETFFVEAPSGVLGCSGRRCGVGVLPPGAQAREVLAAAADTGAHAIFGVPVHFDLLSRAGELPTLPNLRLAVSAGEILPASTYERFAARFGLPISPVYGMTEVGVIATDLTGEHPPPVVGRPAPGID
jgi:acyl-CoA synthetase (AMP-forming)/AMP-acid ligase II